MRIYSKQKSLTDSKAEFYALRQNNRQSIDYYFYHLYPIYEKVIQQQWWLHFQVMTEETICDRFISHLNDGEIQQLLEVKVIYNHNLSVLAAGNCALCWANKRPQTTSNACITGMNAVGPETVQGNFLEIFSI